jgi:succinate-acetate transporter protein
MPKDTELANPEPIGLMGFALTTFIVGLIETNWLVSGAAISAVIPLAIAYGGTIQLFAGLLAWRNGNTFAQTAFLTYGAYWWWFALFELFSANGWVSPEPSMTTFGVISLGFGVVTLAWFVGALHLNMGLSVVFATLTLTYSLIGIGYWLDFGALNVWGGYFALASALSAAYVAFATVTNWSAGRDMIPLGPAPLGMTDEETSASQAD